MFELLLKADEALGQGRLDDAEKGYERVLDIEPTNAMAVAGLARVALERDDIETASILADRALALDPQNKIAAQVAAVIAGDSTDGDQVVPGEQGEATLDAARKLEALAHTSPRPQADTEAAVESARALAASPGAASGPESEPPPDVPAEVFGERRAIGRQVTAAAAQGDTATKGEAAQGPAASDDPPPAEPPRHREVDLFALAEAAAAIEAVDEFDSLEEAAAEAAPQDSSLSATAGQTAEAEALREALDMVLDGDEGAAVESAASAAPERVAADASADAGAPGITEDAARAEAGKAPRPDKETPAPEVAPGAVATAPEPAEPEAASEAVAAAPETAAAEAEPAPEPAAPEASPAAAEAEPESPELPEAKDRVEESLEEALAEFLDNDIVWEVASSTRSKAPLARAHHAKDYAEGSEAAATPDSAAEKPEAEAPPDERRRRFLGRFGGR